MEHPQHLLRGLTMIVHLLSEFFESICCREINKMKEKITAANGMDGSSPHTSLNIQDLMLCEIPWVL